MLLSSRAMARAAKEDDQSDQGKLAKASIRWSAPALSAWVCKFLVSVHFQAKNPADSGHGPVKDCFIASVFARKSYQSLCFSVSPQHRVFCCHPAQSLEVAVQHHYAFGVIGIDARLGAEIDLACSCLGEIFVVDTRPHKTFGLAIAHDGQAYDSCNLACGFADHASNGLLPCMARW